MTDSLAEKVKLCPHCKIVKPDSQWTRNIKRKDGLGVWCKTCVNIYGKTYYEKNKDRLAPIRKKWEEENRQQRTIDKTRRCRMNPQREANRAKRYNLNLKLEMIAAYGGKCLCCGESRWEFLTIDHINGDGAQERKKSREDGRCGAGLPFYYVLKKQGWPQDRYQLLCMNCNAAHGFYGYCPHELEL